MLKVLRRAALAAAPLFVFAMPAEAATFVQYKVSGAFTPTVGYTITNTADSTTIKATSGFGSSLTYHFLTTGGGPVYDFPLPPVGSIGSDAGFFTIDGPSGPGSFVTDSFAGIGFTVSITQLNPLGNGNISSLPFSANALITTAPGASNSTADGNFLLDFDETGGANFITIPSPTGLQYEFKDSVIKSELDLSGNLLKSPINIAIYNNPNAPNDPVPLPAVAPAAFLLMGALGLRRNRKIASAD